MRTIVHLKVQIQNLFKPIQYVAIKSIIKEIDKLTLKNNKLPDHNNQQNISLHVQMKCI